MHPCPTQTSPSRWSEEGLHEGLGVRMPELSPQFMSPPNGRGFGPSLAVPGGDKGLSSIGVQEATPVRCEVD